MGQSIQKPKTKQTLKTKTQSTSVEGMYATCSTSKRKLFVLNKLLNVQHLFTVMALNLH